MNWLPEHKCGLHLSHNEHRDVYETVEQFYESECFVSSDEWRKAVTFALLCGRPLPPFLLTPAQLPVIEFRQVSAEELGLSQENLDQMRKSIERIMRFHKRDEDGE